MNNSSGLYECESATSTPPDDLYLERLDALFQKNLADIRSFAERESRPYEETRRIVAQWHAKQLFQISDHTSNLTSGNNLDRFVRVRNILKDVSQVLEAMSVTAGVQSFILAVNPSDPSDMGFLGGSLLGREFWRGLRSGGEQGARAFKTTCFNRLPKTAAKLQVHQPISQAPSNSPSPAPTPTPALPGKTVTSKSIKTELYESVRTALRTASGHRMAEMKWTNPERLDALGVRLVGWPSGIPQQNPSTLKSSQNRQLLEALQKGTMRFEPLFPDTDEATTVKSKSPDPANKQPEEEDFSWAYDAEATGCSQPTTTSRETQTQSIASTRQTPAAPASGSNFSPVNDTPLISGTDDTSWQIEAPQMDIDSDFGTYNVDFGWDEFSDHLLSTIGSDWDNDSPIIRPKKRPRTDSMEDSSTDAITRPGDEP